MVTDRGRSYDAQALSGVKQQKCLAHVLRSISEVSRPKEKRSQLRQSSEPPAQRSDGAPQAYHRGEAADFAAEAERLRREATYHLRDRSHVGCGQLEAAERTRVGTMTGATCCVLDDPSIEPTNNRAERALRGAVIARKVSHCSEERRWCGCLLGLHQRNQDPGSQWRRSLAGQLALRCVQRCSGPHSFLLNLSSHSAPLINYGKRLTPQARGRDKPEPIPTNDEEPLELELRTFMRVLGPANPRSTMALTGSSCANLGAPLGWPGGA